MCLFSPLPRPTRGGEPRYSFARSPPLLHVFSYYAFPARWTGNAKIRRGWVPREPEEDRVRSGCVLSGKYYGHVAGIDLTCNGMVKRARSNSLYLVSNDFEMRPGTCEGATFVLNVERERKRERKTGRERTTTLEKGWRRILEISIIFRFVRINDETRPRLSDYPDWSGLEGSDISINPNACVWNINRSVDRVLSSGGEGRVEEAILAGGIGWKVGSSRKWYFHVLCGRRDFNEMIEACCRTCEMMKLQRYVVNLDRFELGQVCWSFPFLNFDPYIVYHGNLYAAKLIYWAVFSKEQVSIDIREMIKSRFFAATKRFHIHRDFKIFSRPLSRDLNTINRAFPDLFFFFKYEFILLSSLHLKFT